MGQASIDAVLAGTKGFAVALLAPLTTRIGSRPRIATDPSQVLALCNGPASLAVVEFTGEGSLSTIQALIRDGSGLRVVAGVPPAHAAAEGMLLAMGAEVGRWDGKTEGVIAAVDRAVSAMAGPGARPAASPAGSSVAQRRPAAPGATVAGTSPVPPRPAAPPAGPRPGAPPPPPRPAGIATGPAPAVPRPSSAAPGPAAPVPGPSPSLAPALRPAPAGPPAEPPPPTLSRTPQQKPASAAGRAVAPAIAPPAPVPPAAPTAAPTSTAPASARPGPTFFDDLESEDISIDEGPAPGGAEVDFHTSGIYVPPPPTQHASWPAAGCSDADAQSALVRALQGAPDPGPLGALAVKVLDSLSSLERGVLLGEPQPIEPGPILKATIVRLRVAEALASAPPVGSAVDTVALSALLGQIDGLLAEVAPLLQAAPEELAPALQAIRNALVSEAIDFSEAAQRVGGTGPAPVAAPRPPPRAPQARVLSIEPSADGSEPGRARRLWMAVVLGLSLLAAAGYHGTRWYRIQQLKQTPPGLPAGMTDLGAGRNAPANLPRVITPTDVAADPAEVQRFKAEQAAKGNEVIDTGNGTLMVVPRRPSRSRSTDERGEKP